MNLKKVYIASSAFGFGLALLFSSSLWWLMFVFLVPLFYGGAKEKLSWTDGLMYGYLLWGISASGVLYGIYSLGSGSPLLRMIPVVFIVSFEAFFTAIWFWITTKIITLLKITTPLRRLIVWVATTYLYFYFVVHYSLSLSEHWEGYFLMHPLLPLAEYPSLLSLLPFIGKELLTLCLLLTNATLVLPLLYTNKKRLVLVPLIGFLPWVVSSMSSITNNRTPKQTPWLDHVTVLPKQYRTDIQLSPLAKLMGADMKQLITNYPQTELILLPEYAVDFDLSNLKELATFWDAQHVGKPVNIIMGGYTWKDDKLLNACYWIYDGKIKQVFNKRHTMTLIEGVSHWYDIDAIKSLYHKDLPPVSADTNVRSPFKVVKDVSFLPYICSELFFNNSPDDQYPDSVIIALCKDTWTRMKYIHRLMYLATRFKAIEWQRPMVYVAYSYNGYIDTHGTITPLNR